MNTFMQDMVSDENQPNKKTIRNIPLPAGRNRLKRAADSGTEEISSKEKTRRSGRKIPKAHHPMLWFLVVVAVIGCIYALTTVFSKATVTIKPVMTKLDLTAVPMTATADAVGSANSITYAVLNFSDKAQTTIAATGSESKRTKASGSITVYNEYSSSPVTLIANTRFLSGDGHIFRIQKQIVVPGATLASGKVTKAGTLTVTVVADEVGEEFNVPAQTFTIPGLKGDPRYGSVYAKSAIAMSGGFDGEMPVVNDADKQTAIDTLSTELQNKLQQTSAGHVPDGFIQYPTLLEYKTSAPELTYDNGSATITVTGTLVSVLLNEDSIMSVIKAYAGNTIGLYMDTDQTTIAGIKDLQISYSNDNHVISGALNLLVSGHPVAISEVAVDNIKKELVGIAYSSYSDILAKYPSVDSAKVSIRPIWKRSFPTNSDSITVVVDNSIDSLNDN